MKKAIYEAKGNKVVEQYNGTELVSVTINGRVAIDITHNMDEYGNYDNTKEYLEVFKIGDGYTSQDSFTNKFDTFHGGMQSIKEVMNIILDYAI